MTGPDLNQSTSEGERVCPHCGTDRYKAERAQERAWDRATRAEARAAKLAREYGLLRAKVEWAQQDGAEIRSGLQRKVTRQARVIRRLEKRLLEQGVMPHEGVVPGDTAPVSDIPEVHVP